MVDINKIAQSMRSAFTTGQPCRVPMLRGKDFTQLLALLDEGRAV